MTVRARRWSDNDTYFGPFTYAPGDRRQFACVLSSGYDDYPGCTLRVAILGHTLIASLPQIIKRFRIKHVVTTWDDATVQRLGRNWYYEEHSRDFGFSYAGSGSLGDGGFLQVFLGPQTMDSSTTKNWCCFTPWNNWRHVRTSYYDLGGEHYYTEPQVEWKLLSKEDSVKMRNLVSDMRKSIPSITYPFTDFDGERLTATTSIREMEWHYGQGWCEWLRWIKNPMIQRSLDIEFSGQTGKKKGSWKGGTTGHSIRMNPGELHQSAFTRYCAEHEMVFGGEV